MTTHRSTRTSSGTDHLRRWPVILLLLILGGTLTLARAQGSNGTGVMATLEAGVLRLGDTTRVTISAVGVSNARLGPMPEVQGLQFGRPSPGTLYQSLSNGRRRMEVRFEVDLRAVEEGEFLIPGFEVEMNQKVLKSRQLELRVVRDLKGEDLGFLEVRPSSTRVVEGQPLTIELIVGIDEQMNFLQPILPWWEELPGTVELQSRPQEPGARSAAIVVNKRFEVDAESLGLQERGGKTYQVFRLERRVLPVRSGTLSIGQSHVEFGLLGESRSLLGSRKRKIDSFFLNAPNFEVEVLTIPTEGQPVDFGGAVGTIQVRARTDTRDVLMGDSIKLTVEWEGEGNLEFFEPPDLGRLDSFRNFRAYGRTEEKDADRRRVTYDIAPQTEDTFEIPAVSLTVYDPLQESYVSVATEPIPIRVRALEGVGGLTDDDGMETARDIIDLDDRPLGEDTAAPRVVPGNSTVAAALFGMPLLLFGLRTVLRKRSGDPARPALKRRRRGRRQLAKSLRADRSPAGAATAFAEFLGARTEEPAAAWEGRGVRQWNASLLPEERLPQAALDSLEAMLGRLEAAVFGGAESVPPAEVLETARELQEAGL